MADERSRVLQQNEKTKGWSTVFTNLGTALTASAFGRLWVVGFDPWVVIWGLLGFFVIRFGIQRLNRMQAEG